MTEIDLGPDGDVVAPIIVSTARDYPQNALLSVIAGDALGIPRDPCYARSPDGLSACMVPRDPAHVGRRRPHAGRHCTAPGGESWD